MTTVKQFMDESKNNGDTNILFCIHSLRGIDINLASSFPEEEEILLLPGSYFEVLSYLVINENLILITLKELMPEEQQVMFPELPEYLKEREWMNKKQNSNFRENEIEKLKVEILRLQNINEQQYRDLETLKNQKLNESQQNERTFKELKVKNKNLKSKIKNQKRIIGSLKAKKKTT